MDRRCGSPWFVLILYNSSFCLLELSENGWMDVLRGKQERLKGLRLNSAPPLSPTALIMIRPLGRRSKPQKQ